MILVALILLLLAPAAQSLAADPPDYVFPLKRAADNRSLVDQAGKPFFWSGDTAWSLIAQLSRPDAVHYLDDRQAKGFNVVVVNLLERRFSDHAPSNFYEEEPFTGAPFTTPNEAYFAHADYVIDQAAQRGIVVLLFPLYLGYGCGNEGWCGAVQGASGAALHEWGNYVGARYKDDPNIVWCIGGDTDPAPVRDKVEQMVAGILEADAVHLMTAHNQSESYAVTPWPGAPWLNLNTVYSYNTELYENCKVAYDRQPSMPFIMIESNYENEHGVARQQLRAQAYWPLLCGAAGYHFGNCPVWHFGAGSASGFCDAADWKSQLDNDGSRDMAHARNLFRSRPWYSLAPDFAHAVMTAGYGTWGAANYATAALTADSRTMIAYLPTRRQVTVDLTKIAGTEARSWWFSPASGAAALIGVHPTTGSQSFTPPSSGDWVLVIDDAAMNYPEPGTPLPLPTPTPELSVGTSVIWKMYE